jgi:hypothetical protein
MIFLGGVLWIHVCGWCCGVLSFPWVWSLLVISLPGVYQSHPLTFTIYISSLFPPIHHPKMSLWSPYHQLLSVLLPCPRYVTMSVLYPLGAHPNPLGYLLFTKYPRRNRNQFTTTSLTVSILVSNRFRICFTSNHFQIRLTFTSIQFWNPFRFVILTCQK